MNELSDECSSGYSEPIDDIKTSDSLTESAPTSSFKPMALLDASSSLSPSGARPASGNLLFPRLALLSAVILFSLPAFVGVSDWRGAGSGGDASPIYERRDVPTRVRPRTTTPTDACVRFSHQSALINSTVYIYGGQREDTPDQKADKWTNDFLTLNLSNGWDTGTPALTGLPEPSGPPAVANGYLWNDGETLYLYGGEYSDDPVATPDPFALWAYDISGQSWSDITSKTSVASDSGSNTINRAGEGAGVSIPNRGLMYYFGGHLDGFTVQGWSQSTPRVYLKSMLEFDTTKKQFNNITEHGLEKAGVPERADGVLVFVPWGDDGILLAIGGGTNTTFSQMNTIDVYNIGNSQWTKQSTDGDTPKYRVNPCAVVGSALDGSSHNVYFFGGQNLQPAGDQTQYDDMWILTIPSFTWIQVNKTDNVPPARSGHTCEISGSQMLVIGGYVGNELSCDSPGIYVFNTTSLNWETEFTAVTSGSSGSSSSGGSSGSSGSGIVQPGGTYQVPQIIVSIVGGDSNGGATVTRPVHSADPDSPVATAAPDDYKFTTFTTITGAAATPTTRVTTDASGHTRTIVSTPTAAGKTNGSGTTGSKSGPNVGAIVGGVVGGIVVLVVILFGAAYWLYRRKIAELRASAAALAEENAQMNGRSSKEGSGSAPGDLRRNDSVTDLLDGEPTFWGVLLSPRRSLRVVNH